MNAVFPSASMMCLVWPDFVLPGDAGGNVHADLRSSGSSNIFSGSNASTMFCCKGIKVARYRSKWPDERAKRKAAVVKTITFDVSNVRGTESLTLAQVYRNAFPSLCAMSHLP